MLTVGVGLTIKDKVLVVEHPAMFVPVTENIVDDVGVTTTKLPVRAPGFQV